MKLLKLVPDDTNIDFVRLRGWAFGLTLLLSVLAVGLTFYKGLNFGVDFEGGLMIEERFVTTPDLDKVRTTVDRLGIGDASLQQFGDPRTITIRLPVQQGGDEGATNAAVRKVETALARDFAGAEFRRYSTVSGKVSGELIRNGVIAVVLAVLGIGLFAIFRFEWQFGVSTVVAIVHDLVMTLGFFAVSQFEFDLNIVAAVLTIIGYSINDKIVIDDRIRENMRRYRKMEMRDIINLSVNETLPRTVMTSVTILLALFALLFLGGHVLRGFTAAMILGIVVGTYSSIYVSSSLLIAMGLRAEPTEAKPGRSIVDNAERVAPGNADMRMDRAERTDGPIISALGPNGFRIDDGYYPALLITPERADAWAPPPLADLSEVDLTPLLALDPPPEFLLLGTGAAMARAPRGLIAAMEARGLGVEAMDSRAAARAWAVLRGEGRWIAGALYPLDR